MNEGAICREHSDVMEACGPEWQRRDGGEESEKAQGED